MRENTDQNNFAYGHFLRSATFFPSAIQPKKAGLLIIIGGYILLKVGFKYFVLYYHNLSPLVHQSKVLITVLLTTIKVEVFNI